MYNGIIESGRNYRISSEIRCKIRFKIRNTRAIISGDRIIRCVIKH